MARPSAVDQHTIFLKVGPKQRCQHRTQHCSGHRFACCPIAKGEAIRSWGLPFGEALEDIPVGAYLCNTKVGDGAATG